MYWTTFVVNKLIYIYYTAVTNVHQGQRHASIFPVNLLTGAKQPAFSTNHFPEFRLRPIPVLSIGPIAVVLVWYRYRRYCSRYRSAMTPL